MIHKDMMPKIRLIALLTLLLVTIVLILQNTHAFNLCRTNGRIGFATHGIEEMLRNTICFK